MIRKNKPRTPSRTRGRGQCIGGSSQRSGLGDKPNAPPPPHPAPGGGDRRPAWSLWTRPMALRGEWYAPEGEAAFGVWTGKASVSDTRRTGTPGWAVGDRRGDRCRGEGLASGGGAWSGVRLSPTHVFVFLFHFIRNETAQRGTAEAEHHSTLAPMWRNPRQVQGEAARQLRRPGLQGLRGSGRDPGGRHPLPLQRPEERHNDTKLPRQPNSTTNVGNGGGCH